MTYEKYDLEEGSSSSKKDKKPSKLKNFSIEPIYIHIGFLILLFIVVLFFVFSDFKTSSSTNNIILIGEIDSFNKSHSGDLLVETSKYSLSTKSGNFDGESKTFLISSFDGRIYLENESLVIFGIGENISFDSNTINLENNEFKLETKMKTSLDLNLKELDLVFNEGRIKYSDALNYNFENASIKLSNFNTSITYDGSTFSFKGDASEFNLVDSSKGLNLIYFRPVNE